MKNKMKKLLLLCTMLLFVLSLTACGEEEALYFDVDRAAMQNYTKSLISQYYDVSEAEQEYYLAEGSDLEKTAVAGFSAAQTTDHVGAFLGFDEGPDSVTFSNGVDGKVICTQVCLYEKRKVAVKISYKKNMQFEMFKAQAIGMIEDAAMQNGVTFDDFVAENILNDPNSGYVDLDSFLNDYITSSQGIYPYQAIDCEVSAIYSKKELIAQAGKNTAIGMGVVFVVLIFISFVISLLKYLPMLFDADLKKANAEKKNAHEAAKKKTEEQIIARNENKQNALAEKKEEVKPAPAPSPAKKSDDLMKDEELVAVITAAINAASSGVRGPAYTASNDTLVVRSIRKVNN